MTSNKKLILAPLLMLIIFNTMFITGLEAGNALQRLNSQIDSQIMEKTTDSIEKFFVQNFGNLSELPTNFGLLNFDDLNPGLEENLEYIINSGEKIDTILLLIKDNKGNLHIDPELIDFTIRWSHQRDLRVFAFIEGLNDPKILKTRPEWGQMNKLGQRSQSFVSPSILEYQDYLINITIQVKRYKFDGICFSNIRFESKHYDFSPSLIHQFEDETGIDFSTLEYPLNQWLLYNFSSIINAKSHFDSNFNNSGIYDIIMNDTSKINTSESIFSIISNFEDKVSDIDINWITQNLFGLDPIPFNNKFDNEVNLFQQLSNISFEDINNKYSQKNLNFTMQTWLDWRSQIINNYLIIVIDNARQEDPSLLIYITQYYTNGFTDKLEHGIDISEITSYINYTLDGSDPKLVKFSTGEKLILEIVPLPLEVKIILGILLGKAAEWVMFEMSLAIFGLFQPYALGLSIDIGAKIAAALGWTGIGMAIATAVATIVYALIAYVLPAAVIIILSAIIIELIKLVIEDPPSDLLEQHQEIFSDWLTSHTITIDEVADRIIESISNNFASNFYSQLSLYITDTVDDYWPDWLPKAIEIPYLGLCLTEVCIWPFPCADVWLPCIKTFTVNIFQSIVDLMSGLVYAFFSTSGILQEIKNEFTTIENKQMIKEELLELAEYGFSIQTPSSLQSVINKPGAVAIYNIRINNMGNMVDRYTLDVSNLPTTLTYNFGALSGYRSSKISSNVFEVFHGHTGSVNLYIYGLEDLEEGDYTFFIDATSQHTGDTHRLTFRLHVEEAYMVEVYLSEDYIQIIPGESHIISIEVKNTGALESDFDLSVSGIPDGWYSLSKSKTRILQPEESEVLSLELSPPRHYSVSPQIIDVNIIASKIEYDVSVLKTLSLEILPFFDISIYISPYWMKHIIPGDTVLYTVISRNLGNVPDQIHYSIFNIDETWYEFPENDMLHAPGESRRSLLLLTPPRHYSTAPGVRFLRLTGTSLAGSVARWFWINILPFYELNASLEVLDNTGEPGDTFEFKLNIQNLGNVMDTFNIRIEYFSLPDDYPVLQHEIQDSWGGLSTNKSSLEPGVFGSIDLIYTIPEDWIGFYDGIYSFRLDVDSTGDERVSMSFVNNIIVFSTLETSLLWIKEEFKVLKQTFETLEGGEYLHSPENFIEQAEEFLNKALNIVNLDELEALNYTILMKHKIDQLLDRLNTYRNQEKTLFDETYFQFEDLTFNFRDLVSLMIDKFSSNPLIDVSLAMTCPQIRISRELDINIARDLLAHIDNINNAIDKYIIEYSFDEMLEIVQSQISIFLEAIKRDLKKGNISQELGNALINRIEPIMEFLNSI